MGDWDSLRKLRSIGAGANRNRGDKLNLRECGIVQAPGL